MSPDDLLKMLDLAGAEPAAPTESAFRSGTASVPTPHATALAVDEWGLRRGRELVAASERWQSLALGDHAAADFFAAAFDPDPHLHDSCMDARRHAFVRQLLETPEYRQLHAATRLDDTAAEIAATHFATQFADLNNPTDDAAASASPDGMEEEMAVLRVVGKAVAAAQEEVGAFHEASSAFGMGPGGAGTSDPTTVAALFKRVRSDPALRRICELAGRFRRVAQSKQRRKTVHGLDDVVGVEPGGDLARLLPHELAKLAVPELELDTLRRLVERQTLCREYHATEPVGKGPIIVTIDESGSMAGEKVHTAKALALALAWIARQQERWAGLVAYSGDSGERVLVLPPGRWDETALADWLTAFIGRGSDLDIPIRELPRMYDQMHAPAGVTDVVMITDALCQIPAPVSDSFCAWKRSAQVRAIALVIDSPPGDLARVADDVHCVRSLDADASAVGRVLSL
jgi:uncharacterized protein with von Willebrand factor type A (vWA) domain